MYPNNCQLANYVPKLESITSQKSEDQQSAKEKIKGTPVRHVNQNVPNSESPVKIGKINAENQHYLQNLSLSHI